MIYLDSAATTLQKPGAVAAAVAGAVRTLASPGRGGHPAAQAASQVAFDCREEAAALFGLSDPERVVFTFNATHALNLAIRTLVRPGDCVLISGYEHNAVTRPLHALGAEVRTAAAPPFRPDLILREFDRLLTPEVSAVVCTHVSNVFGCVMPVDAIARLCRERGVPLIVDAAQSAGCLPVEPERWGAAFVAMPGHKGLYGPQGTGLLLCGQSAQPLLYGGTGSASLSQEMPDFLPDRLEAGTHNMPGIAGLLAGLRFVRRRGVERIGAHERRLIARLAAGLQTIDGVEAFAALPGSNAQCGVLSFRLQETDSELAGQALERRGIAVRCGLHCAPLAHDTVGTLPGGTVRASVSAFSTQGEVDRLIDAVRAISRP